MFVLWVGIVSKFVNLKSKRKDALLCLRLRLIHDLPTKNLSLIEKEVDEGFEAEFIAVRTFFFFFFARTLPLPHSATPKKAKMM